MKFKVGDIIVLPNHRSLSRQIMQVLEESYIWCHPQDTTKTFDSNDCTDPLFRGWSKLNDHIAKRST